MASKPGQTLDVSGYMQGLQFNRYHLTLLVLCALVTFFDGQDFSALAYALPYIRDEMQISDEMTGYVSSAAFLGQMIGSLFGSYLGDIFGRRPVIIVSTIGSAVLTTLVGFASSPEMLIGLRFVSGLAIGGLLAPVWALGIESMPKSMRATSVAIIMMGFSFGGASAAPIANWTAPVLGWQGIFWVCGAMTGVFALILFFMLPESTRWMVATGKPRTRIAPMLARFNPDFELQHYDKFILSDERKVQLNEDGNVNVLLRQGINFVLRVRELFIGKLAFITLCIWAAYFCSSFAIYLKSAYGVIFMENLGIERQNAAWLGSIGAILGALGGALLLALTERRGPGWITLAPLIGIPFVALVGTGYVLGGPALIPVLLIGAVMVGAGHAAVISITSIYYPSAVRATGGGWASFMAKFAAVAAPIYGSQFLVGDGDVMAKQIGAMDGYMFTVLCLAGIVLFVLVLSWFVRGMNEEQERASAAAQPAE
ncbi:MFS transporter [Alteraurantiacibacter aquimixticola]|nr:MFS transporter [Alteraurantiacibacter aquimixticola]